MKFTKRDLYLRKKYSLTEATYFLMVKFNKGACWICDKQPKPGKALNVDHDHKTKQVRGLLCWFCNRYMVGRRRKEHASLFDKTATYLRNEKDWRDIK
jgi:hypothetical protein